MSPPLLDRLLRRVLQPLFAVALFIYKRAPRYAYGLAWCPTASWRHRRQREMSVRARVRECESLARLRRAPSRPWHAHMFARMPRHVRQLTCGAKLPPCKNRCAERERKACFGVLSGVCLSNDFRACPWRCHLAPPLRSSMGGAQAASALEHSCVFQCVCASTCVRADLDRHMDMIRKIAVHLVLLSYGRAGAFASVAI